MTDAKHQVVTFYFDADKVLLPGQSKSPVIAVRPFESGYYPIQTGSTAAELNEPDMTEKILESARYASIAGNWDGAIATPARDYAIAKGHREAMAEREAMEAANAAGAKP
jgi:hypothetical protein